jgi:hypothetical protein
LGSRVGWKLELEAGNGIGMEGYVACHWSCTQEAGNWIDTRKYGFVSVARALSKVWSWSEPGTWKLEARASVMERKLG